jgi:SAM-dependent methyltransferase
MQDICCPVCKSESKDDGIERYQRYTLHWCRGCDLQWWHPMENPGANLYENDFRLLRDFSIAEELGEDHRRFFRYLPKRKGKLLDIDCGRGRFVYEVKRRGLASQVFGLDWDRNSIEVAKTALGLDSVYAMTPEEFLNANLGGGFDIVTFFHVLEHQWDPVAFLRTIRELLSPGGHIALGIPNRNTWGAPFYWDYPPTHLTRWSTKAIRFFLEKYGFSVDLLMEVPASIPEVRDIISSRFNFLRHLEEATALGFKRVAIEAKKPDSHSASKKVARTTLGMLRPLRKGVLFVPSLLFCAILRAFSRNGYYLFYVARKK